MVQDHLALPFTTQVLGVKVTVRKIDITPEDTIVAICTHGRQRQRLPLLDLPLPGPPPAGSDWIQAYHLGDLLGLQT